jgi:UDP-glucose:(heptosyl)LPS alpha-1,3-glucosyltransferase
LKIAIVTEKLDVEGGGAERSTLELCTSLHQLGDDVTLVAGRTGKVDLLQFPFSVHSLSVRGLTREDWWRRFRKAAKRYLAETRFDIVHSLAPLWMADVYQPRGGSLGFSAERHVESYNNAIWRSIKRATAVLNRGRAARIGDEQLLCICTDRPVVAALSGYVRDQFQSEYGMPDRRVRVIRGGIDAEKIQNDAVRHDGQLLRQRFDPNNELAIFVFAAMNFRLKGLGWLIDSASAAAGRRGSDTRDFRVLVIGSEDYARYWRQAQRMGVGGRVIFMGGTTQMPAMLTLADAVVLPTYNDACSRLILEGLAAGRPGITTRFNGAADFLENGKYGITIDRCDDVNALAEAMLKICDRENHQRLCRAIEQDRIPEQVTMRRHAADLLRLYEEILREKKSESDFYRYSVPSPDWES